MLLTQLLAEHPDAIVTGGEIFRGREVRYSGKSRDTAG